VNCLGMSGARSPAQWCSAPVDLSSRIAERFSWMRLAISR
jgi:hypothetical protein